eukprot:gene62-1746_t
MVSQRSITFKAVNNLVGARGFTVSDRQQGSVVLSPSVKLMVVVGHMTGQKQ